jgi:hypothetical protein
MKKQTQSSSSCPSAWIAPEEKSPEEYLDELTTLIFKEYKRALKEGRDDESNGYAHSLALIKSFGDKLKKMDPYHCSMCGKKLKPALECKNNVTGEWDGHSYRCPCWKEKMILSIG